MGAQPTAESDGGAPDKPKPRPSPALMTSEDAFARMNAEKAREIEAYALGVQAAFWGMQWVKAAEAFRLASAPLAVGETRAPLDPHPHGVNVWGHARALPNAQRSGGGTPNTETITSRAIVDLREGPIVVAHPEMGSRYFWTSVWELHGDTHTISQKQDGPKPSPYVIVSHDWKGTVPKGVKTIRARSRYVELIVHMAVTSESDLAIVAALQDGLRLVPLRSWSKDKPTEPAEPGQPMRPLRRPDTRTPTDLLFFEELCETLKDLTIREDERAFAHQLESLGVTLGEGFRGDKLDAPTVAGLKRAVLDAASVLEHRARALHAAQPGGTWQVGPNDGTGLDDWMLRGATGWQQLRGESSEEIIFAVAHHDDRGAPLTGTTPYVLRFPKGQLPPARYWRITMYDLEGALVGNPLNRPGVGNMVEKLQPNADGSLTVFVQHASPGKDKEANWLPAPAGGFFLVMRMYQPEHRMARGEHVVPPLQPAI